MQMRSKKKKCHRYCWKKNKFFERVKFVYNNNYEASLVIKKKKRKKRESNVMYSKFKISNYYFAKRDTYNTRDVLLIQHAIKQCKTNMKINVQDESRMLRIQMLYRFAATQFFWSKPPGKFLSAILLICPVARTVNALEILIRTRSYATCASLQIRIDPAIKFFLPPGYNIDPRPNI